MKQIKKQLKVPDMCHGYKVGNDGFCKHYTGSKRDKENCNSKCKKKQRLR